MALEAWQIDHLNRQQRELERLREEQRPRQYLPLPEREPPPTTPPPSDRGVVIIDYSVE
jgi:hypothetical protein